MSWLVRSAPARVDEIHSTESVVCIETVDTETKLSYFTKEKHVKR